MSNSLLARLVALSLVAGGVVILEGACETGGKEGWKCNPLVLQDECSSGLRCTSATCSEAYCCPTSGSSTDPHCGSNVEGCPDPDAGDEGGSDAAETGADATSDAAGGGEADADASDGGDSG
jgi:hypothetical protein